MVSILRSERLGRRGTALPLAVGLLLACGVFVAASDTADGGGSDQVTGGDLVVLTAQDLYGFDPLKLIPSFAGGAQGYATYDPLMRQNADASIEPFLAESLASEDAQTWTIGLRDGITFTDGTPLDAEAVKINIERHMVQENSSIAYSLAQNIESVTVVDAKTVELTTKFPWPAVPLMLASTIGMIASPTAIESGTLNEAPVGTGPFTLEERLPGDHTTFVRNDNYWRDGEPYLDSITFRSLADDIVRQTSIEQGEVDVAQAGVPNILGQAEADGFAVTRGFPTPVTIQFNTRNAPLDNVDVRRALAMALDYDVINDVMYDGSATVTHSMLSEESPYFDSDVEYPDTNVDEATDLIADYEASNGPIELTYSSNIDPSRTELAELVKAMWGAIGVDVTTDLKEVNSFVQDIISFNYNTAIFTIGAQYLDPDQQLYQMLHSAGSSNYSGYSNPEMDAALDAGRSIVEAERTDAYSSVQQLLAEEVPWVTMHAYGWGWVMSDGVEGLEANPDASFYPGLVSLKA